MKKTMTIEEFRAGLNEMLDDAANPDGELASILAEGKEFIAEAERFDPVFSGKLQLVLDNFVDVVDYVKARAERN